MCTCHVDIGASFTGIHSNEYGPQWCMPWPSTLQGVQLPPYSAKGKYRAIHYTNKAWWFRSDILPATMPQTMTQCSKNLHTVTSSRLALNLMWNTNTSGKFTNNHIHLYFTVFCSHRCLAHIINLATQAVIARCSKAKYYNSNMDHDELPKDLGAADQDEIGIIHAICVKVCHL